MVHRHPVKSRNQKCYVQKSLIPLHNFRDFAQQKEKNSEAFVKAEMNKEQKASNSITNFKKY